MGLIGHTFSNKTQHPQSFIDLLYEEIFDHHDSDVEVDVFVAIKSEGRENEQPPGELTVIDFVVARVDDEQLLSDRGDPIDNLRAGVAWAAGVIDTTEADAFVFMHKHAPDFPTPGRKDHQTAEILTAIDFGYGLDKRMFVLMAIVNRDRSTPLSPGDHPRPIGNIEIDGLTTVRMGHMALKQERDRQPAEQVAEFEDLLDQIMALTLEARDLRISGASDSEIDALRGRMDPVVKRSAQIAISWAPPGMAREMLNETSRVVMERIFPMDDLPPELKELLERLMDTSLDEQLDDIVHGGEPLPYSTPSIQMLPELPAAGEPGEARPQPSDIFALPDLDPKDPEIRWDN